jgi:hypothetical protein
MASANFAAQPSQGYGANKMKRRDFLKKLLLVGIFMLFGKKVRAEKKPENNLKEAMFWRKTE